ncbi:MAG: hypothetical protein ACE365_07010 [Gammaproteobacteria bacterium]
MPDKSDKTRKGAMSTEKIMCRITDGDVSMLRQLLNSSVKFFRQLGQALLEQLPKNLKERRAQESQRADREASKLDEERRKREESEREDDEDQFRPS